MAVSNLTVMSDLDTKCILLWQFKTSIPLSKIGRKTWVSSMKYTYWLEDKCLSRKLPVGSCAINNLSFLIFL